jgi:hypothetical protein
MRVLIGSSELANLIGTNHGDDHFKPLIDVFNEEFGAKNRSLGDATQDLGRGGVLALHKDLCSVSQKILNPLMQLSFDSISFELDNKPLVGEGVERLYKV